MRIKGETVFILRDISLTITLFSTNLEVVILQLHLIDKKCFLSALSDFFH